VLAAVLRDQPTEMDTPGARFSPRLKQLVARCLAKQPGDRFASVSEVALALKTAGAGDRGQEPAVSAPSTSRPGVPGPPLPKLSANKMETDGVVDGMTEALIAALAKNRALRVVSRTTVMRFKDTRETLRQIARELRADAIVEGSMLIAGPRARITAQLIRADA